MYNIEVENAHTYFVGDNEILVHNKAAKNPYAKSSATKSPGLRNTPDQDAVLQLGKEAKANGGVSSKDAQTLLDWADEYNVPHHGPEVHPNRPEPSSQNPHFHIGKTGHIPITD